MNDIAREEALRSKMYPPELRWRHLLARIAWIEKNIVRRNTPQACKAAEERGLGRRHERPHSG